MWQEIFNKYMLGVFFTREVYHAGEPLKSIKYKSKVWQELLRLKQIASYIITAQANYRSHSKRSQAFCHKQLLNKEFPHKQIITSIFQLQAICHMHFVNTSIWESSK